MSVYRVLRAKSLNELEQKVNDALLQDAIIHGGVSQAHGSYIQAVEEFNYEGDEDETTQPDDAPSQEETPSETAPSEGNAK